MIVVGEGSHGTKEAPAFVAGLLCRFAMAGKPVMLAWEYPRDRQAMLNQFLDSDGEPASRQRLVDAVLRSQTGQSSLAVLDMLDTARRLRREGHQVAVSLVDHQEADLLEPLYRGEDKYRMSTQARRQAVMAANVESRAEQYPNHAIVFFTAHAARKAGTLGTGYESATLLLSRRIDVYVVAFQRSGGTAWQCRGSSVESAVCKEYPVRPGRSYDDADRYVILGEVTASPPASAHPDPIYVPTTPGSRP